jgi:hypothetical protein
MFMVHERVRFMNNALAKLPRTDLFVYTLEEPQAIPVHNLGNQV